MRPPTGQSIIPRAIVAALAICGCGGPEDDLPRQSVSGEVTLDGEPLESGSINFTPKDVGRADATAAGAVIIDGEYSIQRDKGPTPGTYLVSIFSDGPEIALEPGAAPGMPPDTALTEAVVAEAASAAAAAAARRALSSRASSRIDG